MPKIADLYATLRVEGDGKFTSKIGAAVTKAKTASQTLQKSIVTAWTGITAKGKDLVGSLKGVGEGIKHFADKAKVAFAGLLGLVAGSVAQGDWKTWQDFKIALELLARTIGVMLAPLVQELTGYIMSWVKWLHTLTPAQQKNVVWWVKTGIILTGIVMIMPKVISALTLLLSMLGRLGILGGGGLMGGIVAAGVAIAAGISYLAETNKAERKATEDRLHEGQFTSEELEKTGGKQIMDEVRKGKTPEEQRKIVEQMYEKEAGEYNTMAKVVKSGGYASDFLTYINEAQEGLFGKTAQRFNPFRVPGITETRDKRTRVEFLAGLHKRMEGGKSADDITAEVAKEDEERKANGGESLADKIKKGMIPKQTQLMGIADAWRNAMQNNVETPEARYQNEMIRLTNELVELTKNNKPQEPKGSTL